MENEILEFIDDVRTQYPEIVDDDPIINESDQDIFESDQSVLALSENRIINNNDINMIGGIDRENKSDILVSGSDAVNNIRSAKSISLIDTINGYDSTLLFDGNTNLGVIQLNDNIDNYDLLIIHYDFIVSSSVIDSNYSIVPVGTFDPEGILYRGNYFYRIIPFGIQYKTSSNTSYLTGYLYQSNDNEFTLLQTNSVYFKKIYGLKSKQIVESEPEQPTTSGNTIINNYYGCVSDDSLSYNLLNKPLNYYSVSESMGLYMFCIMGFVAIGLLIKKTIFRER